MKENHDKYSAKKFKELKTIIYYIIWWRKTLEFGVKSDKSNVAIRSNVNDIGIIFIFIHFKCGFIYLAEKMLSDILVLKWGVHFIKIFVSVWVRTTIFVSIFLRQVGSAYLSFKNTSFYFSQNLYM